MENELNAALDISHRYTDINDMPARFEEAYTGIHTYRRQEPKICRNQLCPCGSGKKYKFCCINKENK